MMRKFDLDAAKRGEPVQTRDGRPARIVCWDRVTDSEFPIVVLINAAGREVAYYFRENGRYYPEVTHPDDLVMAPSKRVLWLNVYPGMHKGGGFLWPSERQADECAGPHRIGPARRIEIEE